VPAGRNSNHAPPQPTYPPSPNPNHTWRAPAAPAGPLTSARPRPLAAAPCGALAWGCRRGGRGAAPAGAGRGGGRRRDGGAGAGAPRPRDQSPRRRAAQRFLWTAPTRPARRASYTVLICALPPFPRPPRAWRACLSLPCASGPPTGARRARGRGRGRGRGRACEGSAARRGAPSERRGQRACVAQAPAMDATGDVLVCVLARLEPRQLAHARCVCRAWAAAADAALPCAFTRHWCGGAGGLGGRGAAGSVPAAAAPGCYARGGARTAAARRRGAPRRF
jgi:hypothetical protein